MSTQKLSLAEEPMPNCTPEALRNFQLPRK